MFGPEKTHDRFHSLTLGTHEIFTYGWFGFDGGNAVPCTVAVAPTGRGHNEQCRRGKVVWGPVQEHSFTYRQTGTIRCSSHSQLPERQRLHEGHTRNNNRTEVCALPKIRHADEADIDRCAVCRLPAQREFHRTEKHEERFYQ